MTDTAAKHMYTPGRYVPLQIQEKAICYGVRAADPQKKPGFFIYRIDMYNLAHVLVFLILPFGRSVTVAL